MTYLRINIIIKPTHPPGGGYKGRCILNNEQKKAVQALKTAKGQIEGTIKMIEEGRYCVDVSNQIVAAHSLLKKANLLILKQHMNHCVIEAVEQNKGSEKIEEIIDLLSKVIGK